MKKHWMIAALLGAGVAALYFASMASFAFPGQSAHLLAVWNGLDAAKDLPYPLMSVFAKALGGGNLLAPISGGVAAGCLYLLVVTFLRRRIRGEYASAQRNMIATIAGVASVIIFALTPSVRSAGTHIEPRLFDFAWALLSFLLVLPMASAGKWMALLYSVLMGVMAGLGFCDSALFVAFVPFYIVMMFSAQNARGGKPFIGLLLFGIAFLVTTLVALKCFGNELVPFLKNVAKELRFYCRGGAGGQVLAILVAAFSTVPFVTALLSSGKAFNRLPDMASWMFHVGMTFVSILGIATPLASHALMEPYGIFPVATAAFAATVAGYLIAYWWLHRKAAVGIVFGGILTFVLLVTCVWNLCTFNGAEGDFADKVAGKIISDLGDRKWLITDGMLDDNLRLAAAQRGVELNIVSLARDLDKDYLEKLSELVMAKNVGGSKNGELVLSLSLGVLPFVQDWFNADPSVVKDVAIYGAPDLWLSAGITPVPEFLFFGGDEKRVPDWGAWKEFDEILSVPEGWGSYKDRSADNPITGLRHSIRRHLGLVANNRGVYLQDQKKDDEAFAMYELVLNEIDPDNVCALFNEIEMVNAKHAKAVAKEKELNKLIKSIMEDKGRRYILWRLGSFYGYIRNPDIFIRNGYTWARSGRPGDALAQIRRAIDFVPTNKRAVLLNMMASLYASGNDKKRSREIYETVLASNATDHDANIGLMRIELLDGNVNKALEYLERAAESSEAGRGLDMELAMIAMIKNNLHDARDRFRKLTDSDPKDLQAWSLLAAVTMQICDASKDSSERKSLERELADVILPSMERQSSNPFDYYIQTTKAFLLMRQGEEKRREARDAFAAAIKDRPDVAQTQDLVLGLDISLNDTEEAEQHARDILRRNRNAPLANYVMGSLALSKGDYTAAESYLRKAADAQKPVPLALNDLAEVLRRNHNYGEAERYARKTTEVAPGLYVAWETLGSILMDAGRNLDEAEACIKKACELSKSQDGKNTDVRMLISLARVQLKNDDKTHAKVSIREVESRIDELSEFEKKEFEELKKRVR